MLRKLITFLDLRKEIEEKELIHQEIERGIVFKGTNLYILVFAIVVASVGLNTNSPAVIIGAMLISPLMGPINGLGYSIAIYDFVLFKKSLKNFGFAVGASLFASTIYFAISPVSTAHSELFARTHPTIYDVLIALFGGLAGVLAISSKLKGNVIPGVAIATALMPPLCTAGYGIATGQFEYFFGAFYLFTINTVFIALATIIVSQYLKFPIRSVIDPSKKKKINRWISVVIIITLLPSVYFGYKLVLNEKFYSNAESYCQNITDFEGAYLIKHNIDETKRSINLVYGGAKLTEKQKELIIGKSSSFDLGNAEIKIDQGFAFSEAQPSKNNPLDGQLNAMSMNLRRSQEKLDSVSLIPMKGKDLYRELKVLFPVVQSCSYSEGVFYNEKGSESKSIILVGYIQELDESERKTIKNWLDARLKNRQLKVIFEKQEEKQKSMDTGLDQKGN